MLLPRGVTSPLVPSLLGVSTSPSYLQGVIVLLPDLLILLFQVLKVLFLRCLVQELRALTHRKTENLTSFKCVATLTQINSLTIKCIKRLLPPRRFYVHFPLFAS